ncbi:MULTISPECIES: 2-oxoglutarate dehydrogenase complex dihydrolipoyllysine-residue succinyltransferase [Mesobacillus]|uniref:2-oxoglutarate dehydrogenase complex dihydrolipoyllysine-residue succinyltransferase n=1 Tax=Mesobacillus TaxID=2675231 RepID=UPI001781DE4A|nr:MULTISPECIES: 2-oxoglutarate dehydrogenase complex dihydrolipoyllysine-residue succinyltransferase [Mesobacillus]MCM3573854.1 2-oxoglutarate dehydrogenase complex dihydrolipoyllysine-residue succinyltransferase [Mesobacillus subterraneus]UYZ20376.1 2-oxoglutarate dehydrogenase complex dihydrolipoyllysine-residue succinyltransferase [Mesobacillus jeotgali]
MAEIKVPELAESITEGTIAQWLKKKGDQVEKGEYVVELETDKVNVEIISDYDGVLTELLAEEGDTVKVGEAIAIVGEQGSAGNDQNTGEAGRETESPDERADLSKKGESTKASQSGGQPAAEEASSERIIASPAARKLAREKGIDLSKVTSQDPLGRVRKQDVESFNPGQKSTGESAAQKPAGEKAAAPKASPAGNTADDSRVERIKMSRRRQTIANRLVEVQQTAAMLTTFNEVDMTAVMELRKKWKDRFYEENDVRLGFMSFFTKAVVAALKKTPYLNAEIQGDEIVLKKFYDIGVAVAADEGLVVPVIRDADRKNFAEIENDINELAEKARTNKLSLKDLQGGSFTITNGGVFGSLLSTPIINGPQVGILGMHTIQLRPVAIDKDRMENRPMMYIALSYDHRIVDGKEAVTFLKRIKELMEDPESLLLQG